MKIIFISQLIFSTIGIIIIFVIVIMNNGHDKRLEKISNIMDKNINISNIYENGQNNQMYFGKIYIDKINLEYTIFNEFSDDLLKISLCKFHGGRLGEAGNICVVGHNYENNAFFSNLNKLELNDEIILESLDGKKYKYLVYEKREIESTDISVLESKKKFELTLITCNNSNKKRIAIKAYMNKI